ncbi:MAG: alpha/beta fold hydrolase, partial [Muribaculaceae bacterium]|nr:alpha/beta fold hydrolase [Muribaculaceae bacterium]
MMVTMGSLLLPLAFTSCKDGEASKSKIIDKPDIEVSDGKLTPEVLSAFGRINEAVPSPDGSKVLFTLSYEDIEENRSNAEIYSMDADGANLERLTKTSSSESNIRWIENGAKIAFIKKDDKSGKPQIHIMNQDGSDVKCLSSIEDGVECFEISPDEKKIIFGAPITPYNKNEELFKGLSKTTGRLVDDLMYKHWDEWVTQIPHPFVADFSFNGIENPVDIMEGEPFECPMRPFGGAESFAWSPDSKSLVYVSRKLKGADYAFSTNSNLYLYSLDSKQTKELTTGNQGYDTNPSFSPDGTSIAWLSMETPKYESDKKRLMLLNLKSGEKKDLTEKWDYWPEQIAWAKNGASIWFTGYYQGVSPVFKIDVNTCAIDTVANGVCDYASVSPVADNAAIVLRHSMRSPNEICLVKTNDKEVKQLTNVNTELLGKLKLGEVKKVMVPTTDGKEMTSWVILPPDFDPNKKYPAILYCQGGPQSAVSQFWSYRWNFMIMAANGYVVIAPNRRGVPGFGTEWNRQISGDYGGQNMKDYLSAADYIASCPYVDEKRVAAVGASYGGFSVYWLAGHHEGRFAALIAHAGIFNVEAQYLET